MPKRESQSARAFSEDGANKTHVGGQALIEGVMMRGRYNWAVAVREPAGSVYVEEHDLASGRPKNSWMNLPLIRGCRALVESLVLGFKALEIASMHAFAEEEEDEEEGSLDKATPFEETPRSAVNSSGEPTNLGATLPRALENDRSSVQRVSSEGAALPELSEAQSFSWKDDFGNPDEMIDALGAQRSLEVVSELSPAISAPDSAEEKQSFLDKEVEFGHKEMVVSMVLGVALGIALFIAAPALLTNLIVGEYDQNTFLWNVVDGVLRVGVFVFYLWLIGRMSDIKRMFSYHGAEHKTIHCYEHGLPLTPENARQFPRLHVRCGTAFLIMVMVIAILVYTIVPLNPLIAAWGVPDGAPKLLLVMLVRILFMPVIAGISYEITVKWAGSHPDNPLVKIILWPGMQMQYLTTNEPDDGMLECAIAAMKRVLEREEAEAAKAAEAADAIPSESPATATA